jgi:hypothetical protein
VVEKAIEENEATDLVYIKERMLNLTGFQNLSGLEKIENENKVEVFKNLTGLEKVENECYMFKTKYYNT